MVLFATTTLGSRTIQTGPAGGQVKERVELPVTARSIVYLTPFARLYG